MRRNRWSRKPSGRDVGSGPSRQCSGPRAERVEQLLVHSTSHEETRVAARGDEFLEVRVAGNGTVLGTVSRREFRTVVADDGAMERVAVRRSEHCEGVNATGGVSTVPSSIRQVPTCAVEDAEPGRDGAASGARGSWSTCETAATSRSRLG